MGTFVTWTVTPRSYITTIAMEEMRRLNMDQRLVNSTQIFKALKLDCHFTDSDINVTMFFQTYFPHSQSILESTKISDPVDTQILLKCARNST